MKTLYEIEAELVERIEARDRLRDQVDAQQKIITVLRKERMALIRGERAPIIEKVQKERKERTSEKQAKSKARRDHVFALRKAGATFPMIGKEIGVSSGRARDLFQRAQREAWAEESRQSWSDYGSRVMPLD